MLRRGHGEAGEGREMGKRSGGGGDEGRVGNGWGLSWRGVILCLGCCRCLRAHWKLRSVWWRVDLPRAETRLLLSSNTSLDQTFLLAMPPKRPATTFTTDAPSYAPPSPFSPPSTLPDVPSLLVLSSPFCSDRAAAALAGKRVKFAPNNAEAVAADPDADDLDLDLEEGGGGTSKKKVVTDGYDSDSSAGSDGGFGGAGGGRAGRGVGEQAAEPDDDEDDMFGGGPGVDEGMEVKGKKKEKDTLELGDIEGQEFGKGDEEGEDSALEEDEEDYIPEDDLANTDEAPRGKRSKKGMGYQVSYAFLFLFFSLFLPSPSLPFPNSPPFLFPAPST